MGDGEQDHARDLRRQLQLPGGHSTGLADHDGEATDLTLTCLGERHDIKHVPGLKAMESVITSSMKFRMCAADRAFRSAPRFHNNRGLPDRDRQVVHACLLHTGDTWTKDLVDALHGWESRCVEMIGTRRWCGQWRCPTRGSSCESDSGGQRTLGAKR